jgi:hypothetical protein
MYLIINLKQLYFIKYFSWLNTYLNVHICWYAQIMNKILEQIVKKKDVVKTMFANTVNPVYKGHSQEPENCTHRNRRWVFNSCTIATLKVTSIPSDKVVVVKTKLEENLIL